MAPTPVLLPGKPHGRRSLVGCSPWGCYELDTTERLHFHTLEKEMATTPVFLPGESQGWMSLVGCRLWGRTGSDTAEVTQQQQKQEAPHTTQGHVGSTRVWGGRWRSQGMHGHKSLLWFCREGRAGEVSC